MRRELAAAATSAPPRPWSRWTYTRLAEYLAEQHADQRAVVGDQHQRRPSRSWVGRSLRTGCIRVDKVRGWLHRRPDPAFDQRLAAIEAAVTDARAGLATVVHLGRV